MNIARLCPENKLEGTKTACFSSGLKEIQHSSIEIPRIPVRDKMIPLDKNEFGVRDGVRDQARV